MNPISDSDSDICMCEGDECTCMERYLASLSQEEKNEIRKRIDDEIERVEEELRVLKLAEDRERIERERIDRALEEEHRQIEEERVRFACEQVDYGSICD